MGIFDWFKKLYDSSGQTEVETSVVMARPALERFSSGIIHAKLAQRGMVSVEAEAEKLTKQRAVKADWADRMQDPVESVIASECRALAAQYANRTEALLKGHLAAARKLKDPDIGTTLDYYIEEIGRKWEGDEKIRELKDLFRESYKNYEEKKRELRAFRKQYRLTRHALVPTTGRTVLVWGIFLGLFSIETFLNAHFFESYSGLGLLGGWFQALVVSGVNIALAGVAGVTVVRTAFHGPGAVDRTIGILGLVIVAALILFFNLGAGHYRSMLGIDLPIGAAEQAAFDQLLHAPFQLSGLSTLGLVVFGIACSSIAAYDGYALFDDPFPTYGRRARAQKDSEIKVGECSKQIVEAGSRLVLEVMNSIAAARTKIDATIGEYDSLERDVEELEKTAKLNEGEISRCHDQLTESYRATVTKFLHADDRLPPFFSLPIPKISDLISKLDFPAAKLGAAERKRQLESQQALLSTLEQNSRPDLSCEVQRLAEAFFCAVTPYYMVILLKDQKHGSALAIEWKHLDTFLALRYTLRFDDISRGAVLLELPRSRLAGKREDVESARVTVEASGVTLEVDTWPPKSEEGLRRFPKALSAGVKGGELSIPELLTQGS